MMEGLPLDSSYQPDARRSSVAVTYFRKFFEGPYVLLVAVGVVDVLPKCLSSKYFFWEPSFAWASLGKLGALREIEWVKHASKTCASLRYYYLGYYIRECPKMRYKAEYRPSELKCAVTGKWTPLDDPDVVRRLEGGSFAPLRAPEAAGDDDRDEPKKKKKRRRKDVKARGG